ncbi:unnamed protein product [Dovyalis caffra]|uniref:DNA2/NAM7 helicase-like C-terminal domain-containing protein n=1 Tax=Dovyalis caffra TaxID=77055 RepID=A0AAV1RR67_9ROSI|nr:unnamed protein product [Dovyalis caffra]
MHPSISLFPNTEFYGRQIFDAPNVKETGYRRRFLKGNMFGSCSFINIAYGKEEFGELQSFNSTVEAAVVADIVGSLFKEINGTRTKTSIGGEEDLIIISTVRSDERGLVGFFSNLQRANVALTRARYCLWIFGNEATLVKSGSIWKKIVNDAKERKCFYNAEEDESLAQTITDSLIELDQLDVLLKTDSSLFRNARWMACFSDDFRRSVERVRNVRIRKEVLSLLAKLSNGWRQSRNKRSLIVHNWISSPLSEQYKVSGQLNMVWTVDNLQENSFYIQVLKVWDILPSSGIPKLAMSLDTFFRIIQRSR